MNIAAPHFKLEPIGDPGQWFAYVGPPRPTPETSNEARQAAMLLCRHGLGLRSNDRSPADDAAFASALSVGGSVVRYTVRNGPAGRFDSPLRRFPAKLRDQAFDRVEEVSPNARKLTPVIRERLTLLAFQILGDDLSTPARLLVAHIPPHRAAPASRLLASTQEDMRGAMGTAMRMASASGIDVVTLPSPTSSLLKYASTEIPAPVLRIA